MTTRAPRALRWIDPVLALLLGGATVAYLASLPRSTVGTDEATYLKEALRLLRGELLYRDIFDLTTPGWMYLMALLFKVFGATFATARVAAAVIQAATAVTVFATCRTIGVRREIAFAIAALCVLSAEVNYPLASQHWLATLLSALVLLTYLRLGGTIAGTFATGVVIGLFISVHQQRGLSIALGSILIVAGDTWYRGDGPLARALVQRLGAFAVGVAAIVGPMLALIVWQSGFAPVWRALVIFPLVEYRGSVRCAWGFERDATYLPARVLKWLPILLLLGAVRAAVLQRHRGNDHALRTLLILCTHCAASILSIWYFPDRIHISLIVPSFAVIAADLLESILPPYSTAATAGFATRVPGFLIALIVTAAIAMLATTHFRERWTTLRFPYSGPFGRIDFPNPESVELHRTMEALLGDVPRRTLYCHLTTSYSCLFVDGRNPTRFELLVNYYNSQAQIAEVTHVLTIKSVPYVMALPGTVHPNDPIGAFIRRNYEPISDHGPTRAIWRRKQTLNQGVD